jgi:hypothetical protein
MKTLVISLSCALVLLGSILADDPLKNGDIIFHTSKSSQSLVIQRATGSTYSHMGIIILSNGRPYVLEAIEPVSLTPLSKWVNRGAGGRYSVKRLKDAERLLKPDKVAKMKEIGYAFLGKHYDSYFEWSDSRQYCSELVYKIFERSIGIKLCPLRCLKSFDLDDPIVKKKLKERYGRHVPFEELVVAPSDIYESPYLVSVPK